MSVAGVKIPPLSDVAAILRASISATPESWPSLGFDPSRLGKLRVEWRILRPLFGGTSPAPKHGPQKAVLIVAPAAIRSAIAPFFTRLINVGWLDGYTLSAYSPLPIVWPRKISAASQILSYVPPAQPAITPCCTWSLPFLILSLSVKLALEPANFSAASFSTFAKISSKLALSSSIV